MKKITLLALSLLLIFTFFGCHKTDTEKLEETPVSDFDYQLNNNKTVTITKYKGKNTTVIIPSIIQNANVTEIGTMAFYENDNIVCITIPDTVNLIDFSAFKGCSSLETVNLSSQVSTIKNAAFLDCINLNFISLPNTLTEIGTSAFENCTSLKEVTIPSGVITWGTGIFMNSGLEKIHLEEGIKTIPTDAFCQTKIRELKLPSSIQKIEIQAFGGCTELELITLNDGLISIADYAFATNTKLSQIVIPKTVENITELAFTGCSSLQKVMFEGNAPATYKKIDPATGIVHEPINVNYTVYYHSNSQGFTLPEWNGYQTQVW